jgi:3-dehydroquinate synthase
MGEQRLRVDLGDARSYDVVVGGDPALALQALAARTCIVLYDRAVTGLAQRIIAALGERVVLTYDVEGGEPIKSLDVAGDLWNRLAEERVDRDAVVVAVGGGTVTDLGGFVAATYNRGLAWCAVPTTLLAAVDAAVGGKTAINLDAGKNLVGAFHHPALVAIDPTVFATLDARDLAAGLAEAVKTAAIADPVLFAYLEANLDRVLGCEPEALAYVVARCVAAKARVVEADEFERTDIRASLNFGHTVGHAIENTCGYGTLRHGEAVALGMRVAVELSRMRGLSPAVAQRVDRLVRAVPTPVPQIDDAAVIAATASDKKRKAGKLRFIVLTDLGETAIIDDVAEAELALAMAAVR